MDLGQICTGRNNFVGSGKGGVSIQSAANLVLSVLRFSQFVDIRLLTSAMHCFSWAIAGGVSTQQHCGHICVSSENAYASPVAGLLCTRWTTVDLAPSLRGLGK